MEIHDRIKELRKYLKLSQEAFGEKIGMSRSMVVNLEMGKLKNAEQVKRSCRTIANMFYANESWLLTGEGEMLAPNAREKQIAEFTANMFNQDPDSFEYKFMTRLAKLNKDEWKVLKSIIEDLAN